MPKGMVSKGTPKDRRLKQNKDVPPRIKDFLKRVNKSSKVVSK